MAQQWITGLIVATSAGYVLWALLLPRAARRGIASALRRLPLPAGLDGRLATLHAQRGTCACDGCGRRAVASAATEPRPVRVVRRRP